MLNWTVLNWTTDEYASHFNIFVGICKLTHHTQRDVRTTRQWMTTDKKQSRIKKHIAQSYTRTPHIESGQEWIHLCIRTMSASNNPLSKPSRVAVILAEVLLKHTSHNIVEMMPEFHSQWWIRRTDKKDARENYQVEREKDRVV